MQYLNVYFSDEIFLCGYQRISLLKSFGVRVLNPLYIRVPQTSTDVVDDFHLSKRVPICGFRHGFMTCLWMDWNAHFDVDHPNDLRNPVCEG